MPDLFCSGLGTGLEHLGVIQVQEEVQVAGMDAERVHRWTKWLNLAICNQPPNNSIKSEWQDVQRMHVYKKVTWKKLNEDLLQEFNQQASGLLFIFSQLKPLYKILHLCIHLEENRGQHLSIDIKPHCYDFMVDVRRYRKQLRLKTLRAPTAAPSGYNTPPNLGHLPSLKG